MQRRRRKSAPLKASAGGLRLLRLAVGGLRLGRSAALRRRLSLGGRRRGDRRRDLRVTGPEYLLFGDAGGFAATAAQIIELGTTHLAPAHHLDRIHRRRIDREYALDAFAI